jgi:zinc/manganese transport system substrate-binding protein
VFRYGILAAALAVAACGSPAPATPAPGAPLAVVASTDVYGSIVGAVGGDRVTVRSIIHSPDADPHEYEATPADAAAVGKAALVVVNGGGYDDFAGKLVATASTPPKVLDVVDLSGLDTGGEFNEHVWYSLPTMKKLADELATDLGAADPADAATFTRNAAAFNGRIDGLAAKVAAVKAAHAGEEVAVTEPVPLYLVQEAGLVDATPAPFSTAVEEGNDPPAAVLDETLGLFTGHQVKALLPNAQTESAPTRQVEQAATAAGIPVVPVTETLPAGTTDYVAWMDGQISALSTALGPAA